GSLPSAQSEAVCTILVTSAALISSNCADAGAVVAATAPSTRSKLRPIRMDFSFRRVDAQDAKSQWRSLAMMLRAFNHFPPSQPCSRPGDDGVGQERLAARRGPHNRTRNILWTVTMRPVASAVFRGLHLGARSLGR